MKQNIYLKPASLPTQDFSWSTYYITTRLSVKANILPIFKTMIK
jgi:hypothetical protein